MGVPQLGQHGPVVECGGLAKGVQHWEQKRATARTGAPQLGQIELTPVAKAATTGLPHFLQKRTPGRSTVLQ